MRVLCIEVFLFVLPGEGTFRLSSSLSAAVSNKAVLWVRSLGSYV